MEKDLLIQFLSKNWQFILTILLSILTIFGGLWKYFDTRNREIRIKEYEHYHTLIERLTKPLTGDKSPWLDIQLASIFELRRFHHYKDLTIRILESYQENKEWKKHLRLQDEISYTLGFLRKGRWGRFVSWVCNVNK